MKGGVSMEIDLEFVVKLLRENSVHEYECSASKVSRANALGFAYHHPQPCDCWLTKEVTLRGN